MTFPFHKFPSGRVVIWVVVIIVFILLAGGVYFAVSRVKSTAVPVNRTPAASNGTSSTRTSVTIPTETNPPDADRDGLPDSEEQSVGTDPKVVDTDGDGLSDREEVKVYQTKPLVADTDADGTSDGAEVAAGNDPNGPGLLLDLQKAIPSVNR